MNGVYVGEAYYRGKTVSKNMKDRQVWNSPATQKGLRCKDQESVISKMESIPYTDAIYPYIVGDMLDYYNERIFNKFPLHLLRNLCVCTYLYFQIYNCYTY